MMRVLWEEWRAGSAASSRILPVIIGGVVLILLVARFHPGGVLLVFAIGGLVGGLFSGTQKWNQVTSREWVSLEKTGVAALVFGKWLGFTLLLGAWFVVLLPPLILAGWVWGLPWSVAGEALTWAVTGAWTTQALGHLIAWGAGDVSRILAGSLVIVWILGSSQLPGGTVVNPLWQIWSQFHGTPLRTEGLFILWGLSVGAWATAAGFLHRAEGNP